MSMNRKQRRANKKPQRSAVDYYKAGNTAVKQRNYQNAFGLYVEAVERDPRNHRYILQLCSLLKNISFQKFNDKAKKVILKCLMTEKIEYQGLAQAWFSILLCDPTMGPFHDVMNGKKLDHKKLIPCLKDPYQIQGLQRLICLNPAFESALKLIKHDIHQGGHYPKPFVKALEIYCEQTEYVFCSQPEEKQLYPIDPDIETLSVPQGQISKTVRDQYEANPYPRWTSCDVWPAQHDPHKKPYNHLIAGCGTGYATCLTAIHSPQAQITAIDLSLTSLSYAKRKAEELGLSNIQFYQADILNLKKLDKKFAVIECSGVLHHMHDPEQGWQCLLEKLNPDGKMHIGLYSEIGRYDVIAARQLIAEKEFKPTHADIIAARQEIMTLPPDHPASGVTQRHDFYSTSSCRDLIFHVQEHCYTLEKLAQTLDKLNLVFEKFSFVNDFAEMAYRKKFPDDASMTNLENWAQFEKENPRTFRGMYQFWCSKKS